MTGRVSLILNWSTIARCRPVLYVEWIKVDRDALHTALSAGEEPEPTVRRLIDLAYAAGAPDNVVRTVTENCRTLKFENSGFEPD